MKRSESRGLMQLLVLAILLLWAGAASAAKVARFKLANGLRVGLERDDKAPRVALSVAYRIGSGRDPKGYRGLAHMVEHLMFAGSAHVPQSFLVRWEQLGATVKRGYTTSEHTMYVLEVPAHRWPQALWLEAERMAFMLKHADEQLVDRERATIRNEWHLRGGDNPMAMRMSTLMQWIYPARHPFHFHRENVGAHGLLTNHDLDAIDLDAVRWFHQRYYRPSNAGLAMVGDFDIAEAKAAIERYFGPIRSVGPDPSLPQPPKVDPKRRRRVMVLGSGGVDGVVLGWPATPYGTVPDAVLDIAAKHLHGPTSAWRGALGRDRDLLRFSVGHRSGVAGSTFTIDAAFKGNTNVRDAEAWLLQLLQQTLATGLSEERLRWCQRRMRIGLLSRLQRLSDRAVYLSRWGRTLDTELARYDKLDLPTVRRMMRQWLAPERGVSVLVDGAPNGGPTRAVEDKP